MKKKDWIKPAIKEEEVKRNIMLWEGCGKSTCDNENGEGGTACYDS